MSEEFERTLFVKSALIVRGGKRTGRKDALTNLAVIALTSELPDLKARAIAVLDTHDPDWRPQWLKDELIIAAAVAAEEAAIDAKAAKKT